MRGWQARSPPRRRGGGCHREAPAYAGCAARSGAGGGEWAGPLPHPNSKVVSSNTVVLLAATKTAKKVALALTAGIWQASPHVVGDLANGDALYEGRCCCSHDSSTDQPTVFAAASPVSTRETPGPVPAAGGRADYSWLSSRPVLPAHSSTSWVFRMLPAASTAAGFGKSGRAASSAMRWRETPSMVASSLGPTRWCTPFYQSTTCHLTGGQST